MLLATTRVEDFDRFMKAFSTAGDLNLVPGSGD